MEARAEQRANAVAKLKRAASLPRMKDGRRPPMHGEAFSEGERSQSESPGGEKEVGADGEGTIGATAIASPASTKEDDGQKDGGVATTTGGGDAEGDVDADAEADGEAEVETEEAKEESATPPATKHGDAPPKRRTRSRSRSRGSKDLKARMRALETNSQNASSDGLEDRSTSPALTMTPTPDVQVLPAPSSAVLMQLAQQQMAQQPLLSPLSPFGLHPGVGAAVPPTSAMPSLQALQSRHLQGLFRSNSAAARMMAMHKLTGGSEPLDFPGVGVGPSRSPTPGGSMAAALRLGLTRNNTVSGGEQRVAARQLLLRTLNERIEKTDTEGASGSEEMMAASVAVTKGRRRRSRRKSGTALVDDREFLAGGVTTTTTSTRSTTPAPSNDELGKTTEQYQHPQPIQLVDKPPSRAGTRTPMRAPPTPVEDQRNLLGIGMEHGLGVGLGAALALGMGMQLGADQRLSPAPAQPARSRSQSRSPAPFQAQPHAQALSQTPPQQANEYEYDTPMSRRGVVVEEEEEDDLPMRPSPPPAHRGVRAPIAIPTALPVPSLQGTPARVLQSLHPQAQSQVPAQVHSRSPSALSHTRSHSRSHSPAQALLHNHAQQLAHLFGQPQLSGSPSMASSDSGVGLSAGGLTATASGQQVPLMLSDPQQRSPFRQDVFPKSPFGTPIKERQREDDEEHVLYPEGSAARVRAGPETVGLGFAAGLGLGGDRELSWIADPVAELDRRTPEEREFSWAADPVPEVRLSQLTGRPRDASWVDEPSRMPVYDEDEEDEDKEPTTDDQRLTNGSPRDSGTSQVVVVELETTPENTPSYSAPPSQHSTVTNTTARESAASASSLSGNSNSAHRGDTSSATIDRAHSRADSVANWEDSQIVEATELAKKRSADSTWSKVLNAITRSGSSLGRRSRTNSIAKRDNNESGRESNASIVSGRRESRGEGSGPPSATIMWQNGLSPSPSASASTPSLAPPARTGVSPIPPVSDTEQYAMYRDPKLFPFPGMVRLQEENIRNKSTHPYPSSPDGLTPGLERPVPSSNSSSSGLSKEAVRERKLSRQASDSRLLQSAQSQPATPPSVSTVPSTASHVDYFSVPTSSTSNATIKIPTTKDLPTTREGVKKWMRMFSSGPSPTATAKPPAGIKKPSLSELLGRRDAVEIISDYEEDKPQDKPRPPNSTSTSTIEARTLSKDEIKDIEVPQSSPDDVSVPYPFSPSIIYPHRTQPHPEDADAMRHILTSSQEPVSSTTPEPPSSADESAAAPSLSHSSHASASSLGSIYSPVDAPRESAKAVEILHRLDQILRSDELNRLWSSAINSPPRRLLLSSPMLQVVNANTVKDRFLFLFTDVLVIAKPILPERDSLIDNPNPRPYPPDRTFLIKNVVHLKDLRLNVDRDDDSNGLTSAVISQRPEFLRNFIANFAENPDFAVGKIIDLRHSRGYTTLGKLLVQLPELDRAKLGEYLSRRTSRQALKAYLDAFGFAGMSIEMALRIFLLSIHLPPYSNALETLLDTFAARWYEANAGTAAPDKDLAMRLARAIVRLNEALHSPLAQESGVSAYSRHIVNVKDFVAAFRAHDTRSLVSDNMLEGIYKSVRQEKLCQARDPSNGRAPNQVILKRSVPSRITYKRQSEPVVLRIPQPDPQLRIQLHGQDLTFEPTELTFAKSAEASFRVTGNSLGQKTMIIACVGPTAPNYTGLPLSTTVVVERAFMRNTFQVAFLNPAGIKRKYMFSVDDPVIRHEWTSSLKRQMETARLNAGVNPAESASPTSDQMSVYRAAEALSFRVLQDTLLGPERAPTSQVAPGYPNGSMANSGQRLDSVPVTTTKGHQRSQSRSQMYRLGAGRHEQDLSNGSSGRDGHGTPLDELQTTAAGVELALDDGAETRLWTSAELGTLCQQNSAIALVLSLLQAALPYDVDDEPHPMMQFPVPPATPVHMQRRPSQTAYQI